jgi:peptidoglycan/xylan/chitin deacetylase (PgdA/CDA1 family)
MNGILTISLDFELHWGGFEKWPVEKYRTYFLNTRAAIPRMLAMFRDFDVHVTWATVGLLFNSNRTELENSFPAVQPTYLNTNLSAYEYIRHRGIGENESEDPLHYGKSLVAMVAATPNQEIGSHTFAHYYCNEPGQQVDQFRSDIQAAVKAASRMGITLKSLVFPRNQFNREYLEVCHENGITSVRSNPPEWFWDIRSTERESRWLRLNRGMDAYLPIGRNKTSVDPSSLIHGEGIPLCIPASRLLRPYRPAEMFLNQLKIRRVANEMMEAARTGKLYHLWWHPHNFGNYPEQNLGGLRQILESFDRCRHRYQMKSFNMGEVASKVELAHAQKKTA